MKNIDINPKLLFPGLGFRPLPPKENVESTLIWYKGTDYENFKVWTESLNEFLNGTKEFLESQGVQIMNQSMTWWSVGESSMRDLWRNSRRLPCPLKQTVVD